MRYEPIIRYDLGSTAGIGHHTRCNLIRKSFIKEGVAACCYVKTLDGQAPDFLNATDKIITGDLKEEVSNYSEKHNVFILDMLHKTTINDPELHFFLKTLSSRKNNKIFMIEGLGDDMCPEHFHPYVKGLFTPYLQFNQKKTKHHYGGKDFILIDSNKILPQKKVIPNAKNLLISFGGVDLFKQTVQVLSCLVQKEISLSCKVTVGPFFEQKAIKEIESFKKFLDLEIIYNSDDLKPLFSWADIAITNTGQTRYELAASGVPFLILPFDQHGYDNSIIFEELGIACLSAPMASKDDLKKKLEFLLSNHRKRLDMSKKGKEFCANNTGADNIVKKIQKLIEEDE